MSIMSLALFTGGLLLGTSLGATATMYYLRKKAEAQMGDMMNMNQGMQQDNDMEEMMEAMNGLMNNLENGEPAEK